MTRRFSPLLLLIMLLAAPGWAQVAPQYEGFRQVRTNGQDSTYGQALTHRYVNGELRFLTLALRGRLHEFRIAGTPLGGTITTTTAEWDLNPTGALNDFNGIWFEQAKNRLWVTSAQDYTNVNHPAKVTLIALGANGSATRIKTFTLNVPAKRVYGGCNAVPAALVAQLGGPYVCGWGGYTSLVNQGGGASIGPAMYAIPDPDTIANGATVQARTILDASSSRGVRKTIPVNYFDGGDARQNPSSRPSGPPLSSAQWLSPNAQGLGWMTWGDSYYNTGTWIGTTYVAVASLCKGGCWYQSSTLAFDGRQFELHQWDGASLGSNPLQRPTRMDELQVPDASDRVWGGNSAAGNLSGATYVAEQGILYALGFPFGSDDYTGRLYAYRLTPGTGVPEPEPEPEPEPDPEPEPTDTTPPTVAIASPVDGAVLSGQTTLVIVSADNIGVTALELQRDGVSLVTLPGGTSPLSLPVDSRDTADGAYTLTVRAIDAAGNAATSAPVRVTVRNTSTPPPPPPPVDAVVSDWSAWSGPEWPACTSSPQTRTETRTRTVVTPASNGGTTPALSETRTASRTCDVPQPDPPAGIAGTVEAVTPIVVERCSGILWWRACTTTPTGETRITIRVTGPVALTPGAAVRIED